MCFAETYFSLYLSALWIKIFHEKKYIKIDISMIHYSCDFIPSATLDLAGGEQMLMNSNSPLKALVGFQ